MLIMKKFISLLFSLFLITIISCVSSQKDNTLTSKEKKEGWVLLFDGVSTNGWTTARGEPVPVPSAWEIKDGVLTILDRQERDSTAAGGEILSKRMYKNFELSLDFMYVPGANSGIKYFVNNEINQGPGCEYQILDDKRHPDAKLGINGNRTLAGLYDLIPPINKTDSSSFAPDKWNRALIIVKDNHVEHWLNGKMTVSYERGNAAWKTLVATSKFKGYPNYGETSEGHILLQDHGNTVSFRNIKIKIL